MKYRRLLKRCIAMLFRAYRLPPGNRKEVFGTRLTQKQLSYAHAIWKHPTIDSRLSQPRQPSNPGLQDEDEDGEAAYGGERGSEEISEESSEDSGEDSGEESSEEGSSRGGSIDEAEPHDIADLGDPVKELHEGREELTAEDQDSCLVELVLGLCLALATPHRRRRRPELVLGLCLALATQPFLDGQPSSTVLVYFSGILGLNTLSNTFATAREYTPHLSGLIYTLRLLFLEYALPLRAYPLLKVQQRPRKRQLDRLQRVRRRHTVLGSESPFDEFISLRAFGRTLAKTDVPPFLLRWSDDGETVSLGDDIVITMDKFRLLSAHLIQEAERLCKELMFDWAPAVDLTRIKDDMTNSRDGESFVTNPSNGLSEAYLNLCHRACTNHRSQLIRNATWHWPEIVRYQKKEEALREALMSCLDLLGGQKPRGSELLSLYCVNGQHGPRAIYVYNASMIYIVRHHKAKSTTNCEFIVARFLPVEVGHVLFNYLVYVRPFIDMLHREGQSAHGLEGSSSPFLFRSGTMLGSKPWSSGRLNLVTKRVTSQIWETSVTSQKLRQLCIGITEKHVREVHQNFNRFDDRSEKAHRNVIFAWQSGHRPLQRGSTYGLDGAFPTTMQPQLLELYSWASSRWHEFLHLPSRASRKFCEGRNSLTDSDEAVMQQRGHALHRNSSKRQRSWFRSLDDESQPAKRLYKDPDPASWASSSRQSAVSSGDFLASPMSANWIPGQRISRSLFGRPSSSTSAQALDERRAIIEFLRNSDDNAEDTLKTRLFCHASGVELSANHNMGDCPTLEGERARLLYDWLHGLRLESFSVGHGPCSLCLATNDFCEGLSVNQGIGETDTTEDKTYRRRLRDSSSGSNGLCQNRRAVGKTIAALCAWHDQVLGKALTELVLSVDGIDLGVEHQARHWFERQNPQMCSIPQILVVFGMVVSAFEFLRSKRGGQHGCEERKDRFKLRNTRQGVFQRATTSGSEITRADSDDDLEKTGSSSRDDAFKRIIQMHKQQADRFRAKMKEKA
ncbi:hypothetical protein HIM_11581 [Hirsutella minnesotensis 3608]|uniref:Uncharacterized protein n=1 Tax=Hirsutella minnesotensis 3608 TaxID=1043627 RepID=A0A0F7ZWI3_9HYPO|nr:hypothetical protein HIM_11581 [Hirsutella minnesotensis 3608]